MKLYILNGSPVPLARTRVGYKRVWDSQKDCKLIHGLSLRQQHDDEPLFEGPLHMDLMFYMDMPCNPKRREMLNHTYHYGRPDIDNLIKFVADVSNGIIFTDDCIISSISAIKKYDEVPRTEIKIRRMDE